MIRRAPDRFSCPRLGFSIVGLDGWTVEVGPWDVEVADRHHLTGDELVALLESAEVPVVQLSGPGGAQVEVFVRPLVEPRRVERRRLLELQLEAVRSSEADLEVLRSTADAVVAGHAAIGFDARLGEGMSRYRLVFLGHLAFAVGFFDPSGAIEDVVWADVVNSIRIAP